MLRSGSSPLSVGALVSMPGRWAGAPARLRSKRSGSAPDPPIGRPEGFSTRYLDSRWTLVESRSPRHQVPSAERITTGMTASETRRPLQPRVLKRVQAMRPLAAEAGLSMAAFAVGWVLQSQNASAAIVGASRPGQLTDNVPAAGVVLDKEFLANVDEVLGDIVERDPGKVGPSSSGPDDHG